MMHLHPSPSRASSRARSFLLLALTLMTLQFSVAAPRAQAANLANQLNITGVQLTNFQIVNGVLHAGGTVTGTLTGLPFTTQLADFALQLIPDNPATPAHECSILHLELAPIHVSLLGLHVDTSRICLDITATQGGGLLGDLLCSLTDPATGLTLLLPTTTQVAALQSALIDFLTAALNQQPATPGHGGGDVCSGQCTILDLVLGPVTLSVLGLNVFLNNCANGPIEICVSATATEGLLGQLLCGLSHSQILNLSLADITQLLTTAAALNADGVITPSERALLLALLGRLIR